MAMKKTVEIFSITGLVILSFILYFIIGIVGAGLLQALLTQLVKLNKLLSLNLMTLLAFLMFICVVIFYVLLSFLIYKMKQSWAWRIPGIFDLYTGAFMMISVGTSFMENVNGPIMIFLNIKLSVFVGFYAGLFIFVRGLDTLKKNTNSNNDKTVVFFEKIGAFFRTKIEIANQYIWIAIGIMIVVLFGIIGLIVGIHYRNQLVIDFSENITLTPIELFCTVFIIDRLIKSRTKEKETQEIYDRYFNVATDEFDSIIKGIKHGIVVFFTNDSSYHPDNYLSDKYDEIMQNFDRYLNLKFLDEKQQVVVSDKNAVHNYREVEINFTQKLILLNDSLGYKIESHLNVFSKIIPTDIFQQFLSMKKKFNAIGYGGISKEQKDIIINYEIGDPQKSLQVWRQSFENIDESIKNLLKIKNDRMEA